MSTSAGPPSNNAAHIPPAFDARPDISSHARKASRTDSIALQRTHSLREAYDADASSLDGELGMVSSTREDLYKAGNDGGRPSRARTLSRGVSTSRGHGKPGLAPSSPSLRGRSYGDEIAEHSSEHLDNEADKRPSNTPSLHAESSETEVTHVDLERQQAIIQPPLETSKEAPDPNLVTWDSPDSQENPRNWSRARKWRIMILVSVYTFFSPLISSIIAPALPIIAEQLNVSSGIAQNLLLSIYILAFAVGPLFLGPLSEMFGRKPVIQLSNLFFIAWTMGCALARTQGQLTAFRFLSGLGGSAPLTTGGGTVGDLFTPEERGKAMAVYSLAPLLGPVIGPIAGAAVVQYIGNWRWIFGIATIACALPAVLGIFFLEETYAPRILANKCARLRKETGNNQLHTAFQPIIQLLASYMALSYGTMYLYLTTFNAIFEEQYNESTFIASLNYISLGIGFTIGGQVGGRVVDRLYVRLKARNGGKGTPEMKLPLMMGASFLVPVGLILFGFTVEHRIFWLVPNIGALVFAIGLMSTFLCMQNYTVDFYNIYAASALSAVGFCRSLCGFALPLAAPSLYDNLGYGYGNLLLGGIAALLGIPAPFLFYKYGPRIRARSPYASGL